MKASFLIIPILLLGAAARKRDAKEGIDGAKRKLPSAFNKGGASSVARGRADQATVPLSGRKLRSLVRRP